MTATIQCPPVSATFSAFDDLQDSHTALEGEVAILSGLLDHGAEFDPAIFFAVERHLKAETVILGAAIEKARGKSATSRRTTRRNPRRSRRRLGKRQ